MKKSIYQIDKNEDNLKKQAKAPKVKATNKYKLTPNDKEYYITKRPIGFFVLINSLYEYSIWNQSFKLPTKLGKDFLYWHVDLNYLFIVVNRLKKSLGKKDRWEIAVDLTSFYQFLRIYYDSLASLIHRLFKFRYSSESRMWPPARSFNAQIKWAEKNKDNRLDSYRQALQFYSFDKIFREAKRIRDRLKEPPHLKSSIRMTWINKEFFSNTKELKREIGLILHKTIAYTDFVGDYLILLLQEIENIPRMEKDHHGYPQALFRQEEINVYKWFVL